MGQNFKLCPILFECLVNRQTKDSGLKPRATNLSCPERIGTGSTALFRFYGGMMLT
ncbi:hypothetical protein J2X69_005010 [Algoriphagus sp. 4150]|nr:hypothetical protein [Algoriphagus sp. 4150]